MSKRSKLRKIINLVSMAYTVNALRKKYNQYSKKYKRSEPERRE